MFLKIFKRSLLILCFGIVLVSVQILLVKGQDTEETLFQQEVEYSGILEILEAPEEVIFEAIYKGESQSNGTLGTEEDFIQIRNHRFGGLNEWTLNLSADDPISGVWYDAVIAESFFYNADTATGLLEVVDLDGVVTIEGLGDCSNIGIFGSIGGDFSAETSVDLIFAGGTSDEFCIWNIFGIGLIQHIPINQEVGTYEIPMVLTLN